MRNDALARSGHGVSLSPATGRGDVRLTPAGIAASIAVGNGSRGARYFHTCPTRRRKHMSQASVAGEYFNSNLFSNYYLDELVYELYGLTDEEIAIVEEAVGD